MVWSGAGWPCPKGRREFFAVFVDGDGVVAVFDDDAEAGVVKAEDVFVDEFEGGEGYAEFADGVPDAHELDFGGVGI